MNEPKRQRWIRTGFGATALCIILLGPTGCNLYRSTHVMKDGYNSTLVETMKEARWSVDIRPLKRIHDGKGDRLVGPPYELLIGVNDPQGRATRARLHAAYFKWKDGTTAQAKPTNADKKMGDRNFANLYAHYKGKELGKSLDLIADAGLFFPDGSKRKEIVFRLRAKTTSHLSIP